MQANKEVEGNIFFRADILQSHIETITLKDIPEKPTNNKEDMSVITLIYMPSSLERKKN